MDDSKNGLRVTDSSCGKILDLCCSNTLKYLLWNPKVLKTRMQKAKFSNIRIL